MTLEDLTATYTYPARPPAGQDPQFAVNCAQSGSTSIMVLVGELDLASLEALEAASEATQAREGTDVIVDLRKLEFIDSTGLRGIVRLSEACSRNGLSLSVVAGPPAVQKAFQLTGIIDRLTFVTGESADALR